MRLHTVAIASAAAILAFMLTPARSADCVEANVTLTAESGEQYVRSCTESKAQAQDITDRRQKPVGEGTVRDAPSAPSQAADEWTIATQSAQSR